MKVTIEQCIAAAKKKGYILYKISSSDYMIRSGDQARYKDTVADYWKPGIKLIRISDSFHLEIVTFTQFHNSFGNIIINHHATDYNNYRFIPLEWLNLTERKIPWL